MPIAQHLELHRNIQQAIAAEETYAMKGTSTSGSVGIKRPLAGLAIAASLVVAVFVGMQVEQQTGGGSAPAVAGNTSPDAEVRTPIAVQTVANRATNTAPAGSVASVDSPSVDAEMDEGLRALDEEGQKRLRAYLHQHDQMARMKSNTSLVTYPSNK